MSTQEIDGLDLFGQPRVALPATGRRAGPRVDPAGSAGPMTTPR